MMNLLSRCILVILMLAVAGCGAAPEKPKAAAKTGKKKATKKVASKKKKPVAEAPEAVAELPASDPQPMPAADKPMIADAGAEAAQPAEIKKPSPPEKPAVPDAPALELVKQKIQFGSDAVTYELMVPADAKIDSSGAEIVIDGGPRFVLRITPGQFNIPELIADKLNSPFGGVKLVEQSPRAVVIRDLLAVFPKPRPQVSHQCYVNCSIGHREFRIEAINRAKMDLDAPFHLFSLTDCQTMRKAAEEFALAEPLPDEPLKLLETLNVKLERNTQDKIVKADFPGTATTSTMKLIENLPDLVEISASGLQVTQSGWESLAKCPKLEKLNISRCDVREAEAKMIGQAHSLKELHIGSHNVNYPQMFSGKALKELEPLKELEVLAILFGPVTDKDFENMTVWPKLRELYLEGHASIDPLHGTGFQQFIALDRLTVLTAHTVAINDEGLQVIGKIKSLKRLRLSSCHDFTDAGVAHLKSLANLEHLDLSLTSVTDASIETLSSMKQLKHLYAMFNKMTDEGRAKLAAALPDCKMESW